MHTKTIIIEDEEKNLFVISAARLIESVRPDLVLMDVRIGDGINDFYRVSNSVMFQGFLKGF